MSEKVFAYGTLRPSLYPGKAEVFDLTPIGRGTLKGSFKMLHLGGFPGLVTSPDLPEKAIIGEVSEVDSLKGLDRYEGYPNLYTRAQVQVQMEDGSVLEDVWVYLYNDNDGERADEVVSGDWADAE